MQSITAKRHWRHNSRMEDVISGLAALIEEIQSRGIRSIAIPPLGCGLGGLDWSDVRPRIEAAFTALPDVQGVYEFDALPLILEAGYAYSSVNDDELVSDASLDGHIYLVGSKFVISPTERLDILPGIAVGRTAFVCNPGFWRS